MNISEWTRERKYSRPMKALMEMSEEQREAIRETLEFSWPKAAKGVSELEAKAILNHDLWGIVGRLHYKAESLNPWKDNLTWRGILRRVLELHFDTSVSADMSEPDLERVLVREYLGSGSDLKPKRDSAPLPPVGPTKKTTAIILVLKAVEAVADRLLDSTDPPAIHATFAICLQLHEDLERECRSHFLG